MHAIIIFKKRHEADKVQGSPIVPQLDGFFRPRGLHLMETDQGISNRTPSECDNEVAVRYDRAGRRRGELELCPQSEESQLHAGIVIIFTVKSDQLSRN